MSASKRTAAHDKLLEWLRETFEAAGLPFSQDAVVIASPWPTLARIVAFALDPLGIGKRIARRAGRHEQAPQSGRAPLSVRDFIALILRIKAEMAPGPASPGG